ncbi:HD-GYP domain-containing protein [Marichromatium bheemlicum]|uniref:HD-GYP domain-containing protein n=1 Tax=Marichromatium bheemlicum TaxID=365339 RepID=A0ABX1I9A9_9GAMM|nr:HD-GYP domain-containing protein [Marichromatium bheemlicum]NKN32802.1 HD-GYP domain-containing protein [Marichromatium bheemlicum]
MIPELVRIHDVVDVVISTLNARDPYTSEHSFRVALYSELLSEQMSLPVTIHQRLHIAAHLHDIGKVGVPDGILNKPGRLTEVEKLQIQLHPRIGFDILQRLPTFREVARIVLHHHERIDGRGYPNRLRGEQIPLESRIIAVADAFDAMTSERPYRRGMPADLAAEEIVRHAGDQFDPEVVGHFERVFDQLANHIEYARDSNRLPGEPDHDSLMHSRIATAA